MTPEEKLARQKRYQNIMETDFGVNSVGAPQPGAEHKAANALEYIAYQMGQMNRNLARLLDHLERKSS